MKKIMIVGLLLVFGVLNVGAETIDNKANSMWNKLSASENFHLLDNLTPATFYDLKSGEWFTGGVTSVYTYKHFGLDIGTIKSMQEGGNLIPMAGINIGIGSFINSYSGLKSIIDSYVPDKSLFEQLTIGGWISRDFEMALTRYGLYAGIEIEF